MGQVGELKVSRQDAWVAKCPPRGRKRMKGDTELVIFLAMQVEISSYDGEDLVGQALTQGKVDDGKILGHIRGGFLGL